MARALKDLLANDHPLFVANIARMERATGGAGIDTRLIGEVLQYGSEVIRRLGLDPRDSTNDEVYNALKNAVGRNLVKILQGVPPYVLVNRGKGPISLNIHDIINNAHHELEFSERSVAHAQRQLRLELVRRYADHDRTSNDLIEKLAEDADIVQQKDKIYQERQEKMQEETNAKKAPTLLAVGDIFTDAFIKLCEDKARIDTDPDGSKRLSMEFGSKPPYERVDIVKAVGPSPNAAVSVRRLGLNVSLRSFIGDDQPGEETIEYLKSEGIATDLLSVQQGIPSNYYYVLRYGADRTILVKNENYSYTWQDPVEAPDWIYLSLLSADSWQLHEDLFAYLEKNKDIKLAFQPGTFQFDWGAEKLAHIYGRSHIVVMNREEAVEVTGRSYDSLKELARGLHELGPEIVVITDGPNGSYAYFDDTLVTVPNYPDPAAPLDRTGAGDAFASTIVAALALGESMETALLWAPINSMSVVQKLGAQAGLLHKDELLKYIESAPDWYRVTEMTEE